ncbi:hypothetical protein DERP_007159, partial [Dermatophagoides pteronyssinus]
MKRFASSHFGRSIMTKLHHSILIIDTIDISNIDDNDTSLKCGSSMITKLFDYRLIDRSIIRIELSKRQNKNKQTDREQFDNKQNQI